MLVLCVLAICQCQAQIVFVLTGSHGDGSSWSNAYGDLTAALKQAKAGDQVWVAKGTYAPSASGDRNASFDIKDGVQVFGGFAGTESKLQDRKMAENLTVLSGEIGAPGMADNAYNVVTMKNTGDRTILDGFTITKGNASSNMGEGSKTRCGGGLYIDGEKGSAKPSIRNCQFLANMGRDGAAVYNNGRNGESSPSFANCSFKNNEAGLDGGALYNDGRLNGKSNPMLTNCVFERNMGTYGGAICNATESGACNLTLSNCSFTENAAYLRGGAVFSMNGDEKCYLEMTSCNFQGNYPDDQNMIFTSTAGRSDAYKISQTAP